MTTPDDQSKPPKPKTRKTQTIVTPPKILEDGTALIASLETRTNINISHSKFLAILLKIAVRYGRHIETGEIWDDQTLEQALIRAIARGAIEDGGKEPSA